MIFFGWTYTEDSCPGPTHISENSGHSFVQRMLEDKLPFSLCFSELTVNSSKHHCIYAVYLLCWVVKET